MIVFGELICESFVFYCQERQIRLAYASVESASMRERIFASVFSHAFEVVSKIEIMSNHNFSTSKQDKTSTRTLIWGRKYLNGR